MQIYAPFEYPDPIYFSPVSVDDGREAFITVRFHTVTEGADFIMDVNPYVPGILTELPHGNLLIDMWSDNAGDDWIASTVFKVTSETIELAESRVFGDWRDNGLIDLMAVYAQITTGKTRALIGMERSMDKH
ncbi:MAG: hypothetical protein ABJL73_11755 [Lentilitoribacter sp.]